MMKKFNLFKVKTFSFSFYLLFIMGINLTLLSCFNSPGSPGFKSFDEQQKEKREKELIPLIQDLFEKCQVDNIKERGNTLCKALADEFKNLLKSDDFRKKNALKKLEEIKKQNPLDKKNNPEDRIIDYILDELVEGFLYNSATSCFHSSESNAVQTQIEQLQYMIDYFSKLFVVNRILQNSTDIKSDVKEQLGFIGFSIYIFWENNARSKSKAEEFGRKKVEDICGFFEPSTMKECYEGLVQNALSEKSVIQIDIVKIYQDLTIEIMNKIISRSQKDYKEATVETILENIINNNDSYKKLLFQPSS